jgi:hypothetical protein
MVGLDEEFRPEKPVLLFRLRLRRFSKEEVAGIEEKDPPTLFSELGDQGRFLGKTAKRIPKSAAGLDFAHHIIRVNDGKLNSGAALNKRGMEEEEQNGNQNEKCLFHLQLIPPCKPHRIGLREVAAIFLFP